MTLWVSRRSFLKNAMIGAAGVGTSGSAHALEIPKRVGQFIDDQAVFDERSPIARLTGSVDGTDFNGDNPDRAHPILWDKKNYLASKGGIPPVSQEVPVIVVGGGLGGLSAALSLADLNPILLEQAPRLGGNAKGERWQDLTYSIGSAFISSPDDSSRIGKLLNDLGLISRFRGEDGNTEPVLINGGLKSSFWDGVTDPPNAAQFKAFWNVLTDIRDNHYPSVPHTPDSQLTEDELNALDRMTFGQWVRQKFGTLHPHIVEYLHDYCWDSMGGDYEELSAALVLNFIAADSGGMITVPGGNSAVAHAIFRRLNAKLPRGHIRTGCLVIDIAPVADGVNVCYEDESGNLFTIHAKACVVSAAKFIAAKLIDSLPQDQVDAIATIRYRAYLVANCLLDNRLVSPTYGVYHMYGAVPESPQIAAAQRPWTSVVFGGWASYDRPDRSALTLYKPLPYDGGRDEIYDPNAYKHFRAQFEDGLPGLLRSLGIPLTAIQGLRIARWGHALPVSQSGGIANGTLALASRPLAGRIFFGQQDNWASPCIETAINSAGDAADQARAVVTGAQKV